VHVGEAVDPLTNLERRIRTREAKVAVVGLGYVGLPVLMAVHRAGFPVLGLELDRHKVSLLLEGHSYIVDVSDEALGLLDGVELGSDPAMLERAEIILVCVPTPLTDDTPDLSMVQRAAVDVPGHD
jgi:UDP-N-acetyl-D-glucosamine dehydrogenase